MTCRNATDCSRLGIQQQIAAGIEPAVRLVSGRLIPTAPGVTCRLGSKVFFFEKKKQKTFVRFGFGLCCKARLRVAEVFCFFSKKNVLPTVSNRAASTSGGESGIRTHGTLSRTHAFQACALNRSAISPQAAQPRQRPPRAQGQGPSNVAYSQPQLAKVFGSFFAKKNPAKRLPKRPSSTLPETPTAVSPPCQTAASASSPPSASPGACACG